MSEKVRCFSTNNGKAGNKCRTGGGDGEVVAAETMINGPRLAWLQASGSFGFPSRAFLPLRSDRHCQVCVCVCCASFQPSGYQGIVYSVTAQYLPIHLSSHCGP